MKLLDYINLCYIWCSSYPSLKNTWKYVESYDDLRVSYGFDRVPGPEEHVYGGLVKLQDLNREFRQCRSRPNLLYLVSSALPYFPTRLAKMAKKAGAKFVINQNGVAYPGWHGEGWEKANRPVRKLHEIADYVVYQSEFCKVSADRYIGPCNVDGEILYNPVDTDFFCPSSQGKKGGNAITLLLAGSHWNLYRPRIALEVLKHVGLHNNIRLKIAGRFCWGSSLAAAEEEVRELAEQLGVIDNVEFNGPYTQVQAIQLLQQSDILLHTKYNDPCPRLVVEAMACGLPIVYSATGGVPELVGTDAGVGVKGPLDWENDHPPDAETMAKGVMHIVQNLNEFSAAARKRAVNLFDVKLWLARHREIFSTLF